jgi:ABC-2 type transport system ATP-binding protein
MPNDDEVLRLQDVSKTYRTGFFRKKIEAVKSVSFHINRGEIFGLIGPNGAGKSTTIRMTLGLTKPDRGQIELFGSPADTVHLRSRLGYVPENPQLYEHLKALEMMDFYGRLFGLPRRERAEKSRELLSLVGLGNALDRPISKFSKGMRQRAGIAQALINDPELIILDEPQSGLDPIGRREIRDLILELRRQGKTVLFCSHILPDVEDICDRVALIDKGKIRESGYLHELVKDSTLFHELLVRGDLSAVVEALPSNLGVSDAIEIGELVRIQLEPDADLQKILGRLSDSSFAVESVRAHKESLQDVFLRDTSPPESTN